MPTLPRELFALAAAYCGPFPAGDYLRMEAGNRIVKSTSIEYLNKGMAKITRKNGMIHSFDDTPAVVYNDGDKEWWRDGVCHHAISDNGDREFWYDNGKLLLMIFKGRQYLYDQITAGLLPCRFSV